MDPNLLPLEREEAVAIRSQAAAAAIHAQSRSEGEAATPAQSSTATVPSCVLPTTSDDTNEWCPLPRVVKIPCKLMLNVILADLGYPKARYNFDIDEHAQVSATVTFYSSAHNPRNVIHPIKIAGIQTDDSEIAKESAAREGIRYMEIWEGLEIKDLHYAELEHVRNNQYNLEDQLKAVQKNKDDLKKELLVASKKMVSFSRKISELAGHNHSLGQGDESEAINAALELFQEVASNLACAAMKIKRSATHVPSVRKSK